VALYLISYDISPDKRRNKLAKLLTGFGSRVQFSVFECDLTVAQYARLRRRLGRLLVPEDGDSVRIYQLCAACVERVEIIGAGTIERTPDVWII
jgi:CRISPR-associated protein Cas2